MSILLKGPIDTGVWAAVVREEPDLSLRRLRNTSEDFEDGDMRSLPSRGQAKPDGTWWRRQPCRDHVVESASTQGLRPAWPQAEPVWALQGATGVFFAVNDSTPWCPTRVINVRSGHFVHVRGYMVPSNPEDRPLLNARSKVEVISLEPTSKDSNATSSSGNAATSWCNLSAGLTPED